jgi:hypothetical protein
LLKGLLTKDPESRYSFDSINDIKNHKWCKNIDWDMLYQKKV